MLALQVIHGVTRILVFIDHTRIKIFQVLGIHSLQKLREMNVKELVIFGSSQSGNTKFSARELRASN